MEEETKRQGEVASETVKEKDGIKFSLRFYIISVVIAVVFIVVSAVFSRVCYFAAALGFSAVFAEFLRLFKKSKSVLLLVTAVISALASAVLVALWVMRMCGLG